MNTVHYPRFQIDLPDGSRDVSTCAFLLPAQSRFSPSVVVKWQDLGMATPLPDYVRSQCDQMSKDLDEFKVVEPPVESDGGKRMKLVFEWGSGEKCFRQLQTYVRSGSKIFSLTGTQLADRFGEHAAEFERIMASFKPEGGRLRG